MLDITLFDTSSYQELLAAMRKQLEIKSESTFYDSDMEIVLLELWALLLDMQNYTMDVTSTGMQREMLQFLAGECRRRISAQGTLFATPTQHHLIQAHTVFDSVSNIPFESEEQTYVQANTIVHRAYQINKKQYLFTQDLRVHNDMQIIVTLRNPMEMHQPFALYFDIRNQRTAPHPDYPQSRLQLSYESIQGRCNMDVHDETMGLLTSGRMIVTPHMEHDKETAQDGYLLYITICDAWYDEDVILHDILLNPILVQQQLTYAQTYHYPIQPILYIQDALAWDGSIFLFIYRNQGYHAISYKRERSNEGICLHITDIEEGEHLRVVIARNDESFNGVLGSSNGVSMQRIPIAFQDVKELQLMIKQGDVWYDADVYPYGSLQHPQHVGAWYDAAEGCIQLGCGKDFLIPEAGMDNILYRTLIISKGKKGNIKEHVLTSNQIKQSYPIQGGEDEETQKEVQLRLQSEVWNHHAITADDIRKLAARFPGNALTYVACIPQKYITKNMKMKGYIVMIAAANELHRNYIAAMKRWLKQQQPLGVEVRVMQAEPLPLTLALTAIFAPHEQDMIKQEIRQWLMQDTTGTVLRCADLIQFLLKHVAIREIQDCYFYIQQQPFDQYQVPYHKYVVVNDIRLDSRV